MTILDSNVAQIKYASEVCLIISLNILILSSSYYVCEQK